MSAQAALPVLILIAGIPALVPADRMPTARSGITDQSVLALKDLPEIHWPVATVALL